MEGGVPLEFIVPFGILTILLGIVSISLVRLHTRLKRFMTGKDGASLEATLAWLTQKVATLDNRLDEHQKAITYIDKRVGRSIRGYSLVHYDAYGMGGGQSFSSALIDEQGHGYILSVVAHRNHTGVYSKRVTAGVAEASLTDEEVQALAEAKKSIT